MTSIRYLTLVIIYLVIHYFPVFYYDNSRPSLIYDQLYINQFLIGLSTFIFFYKIKEHESKCESESKNKSENLNGLPESYIFSQSLFYAIIAILSQYIYRFLLEANCSDIITSSINNINNISYIPEALFIAGFVLLTNNLSLYIIYPKCN